MSKKQLDKFLLKVEKTSDCWNWIRGKTRAGYGMAYIDGKFIYAHIASYLHFVGIIQQGLELDHLCRNRACVNPTHLEAVTRKVNTVRGIISIINKERGKLVTHCRNGHEYTKENTYFHNKRGTRDCRMCRNKRRYNSDLKRRANYQFL